MTADEMFEDVNYTKYEDKDKCKYTYDEGGLQMNIEFYLRGKTIILSMYDEDEKRYYSPELTMQEFKAISKKVEELGW